MFFTTFFEILLYVYSSTSTIPPNFIFFSLTTIYFSQTISQSSLISYFSNQIFYSTFTIYVLTPKHSRLNVRKELTEEQSSFIYEGYLKESLLRTEDKSMEILPTKFYSPGLLADSKSKTIQISFFMQYQFSRSKITLYSKITSSLNISFPCSAFTLFWLEAIIYPKFFKAIENKQGNLIEACPSITFSLKVIFLSQCLPSSIKLLKVLSSIISAQFNNNQSISMNQKPQNWTPIESDPQLWNTYMEGLGLNRNKYNFEELIGLQEWGQAMLSGPVMGLILLYEETPKQIQYQKEEAIHYLADPSDCFFMKQYAHNACGTIAMFHAIINSSQQQPQLIVTDSLLYSFRHNTHNLSPQDRGRAFEANLAIKEQHMKASIGGQSELKEEVQQHYVAIIYKNGNIYEMDGCKKCPIKHGDCEENNFLKKGCSLISSILSRDQSSINCSVIALVKKEE